MPRQDHQRKFSLLIFLSTVLIGFFANADFGCRGQSVANLQFDRQVLKDVEEEIRLIGNLVVAIDGALNKPMRSQGAIKRLRAAINQFESFQRGNGGNYVLGRIGNHFHAARNEEKSVESEVWKFETNNDPGMSKESMNVLSFFRPRLAAHRDFLIKEKVYLKQSITRQTNEIRKGGGGTKRVTSKPRKTNFKK